LKLVGRLLLPLVLGVLVFAQIRRGSELLQAQRLLYSVERRTMAMLRSGELEPAKMRAHLQALADARELDPAEVAVPVLEGSQYLMLGELEPALAAYLTAKRLEPRPEILINLGKICNSKREHKRTLHFFSLAVLLDAQLIREVPEPLRQPVLDALRSQDDADGAD
jgi:cytochrome c-type biogenesis protein CcmH/NrfG